MLDLIGLLCDGQGWAVARLDGRTAVETRQDVVRAFNLYGAGSIFLLSTTAGGAGLNLVGASRLVREAGGFVRREGRGAAGHGLQLQG